MADNTPMDTGTDGTDGSPARLSPNKKQHVGSPSKSTQSSIGTSTTPPETLNRKQAAVTQRRSKLKKDPPQPSSPPLVHVAKQPATSTIPTFTGLGGTVNPFNPPRKAIPAMAHNLTIPQKTVNLLTPAGLKDDDSVDSEATPQTLTTKDPRVQPPTKCWAGYDRDVADAALAQDGIGWRSLLEGCPAIGWETCQTKFFSSINSRQTGRRWMRCVLAHLIEFSFSLWQHRNDIRHSKDEDLQSASTNLAIDAEFELGFQGLHHQFRSRISKPSLKASALSVRQAWLRRVGLLRKILEDQRERRAPPPWVLRTCGIYTWIRHRRPVSPTPALLALYPELQDTRL